MEKGRCAMRAQRERSKETLRAWALRNKVEGVDMKRAFEEDQPDPVENFPGGRRVQLQGLQGRQELNGLFGWVQAKKETPPGAPERFNTFVFPSEAVALQTKNITPDRVAERPLGRLVLSGMERQHGYEYPPYGEVPREFIEQAQEALTKANGLVASLKGDDAEFYFTTGPHAYAQPDATPLQVFESGVEQEDAPVNLSVLIEVDGDAMVRHGLLEVGGAPGVNLGPSTGLKPRDLRANGQGGADDEEFTNVMKNHMSAHPWVLKATHPENEPASIRFIGKGSGWGRFVVGCRPASWAQNGLRDGKNYTLEAPLGSWAAQARWNGFVDYNYQQFQALLERPDENYDATSAWQAPAPAEEGGGSA